HSNHAGFEFVAVADDAADKKSGASGDICEPLGDHASGATFSSGDGGAIFSQHARADVFKRFTLRGVEMLAESERHALGNFIEELSRSGRVAGPNARMQLNSGGRREDCGFDVRI